MTSSPRPARPTGPATYDAQSVATSTAAPSPASHTSRRAEDNAEISRPAPIHRMVTGRTSNRPSPGPRTPKCCSSTGGKRALRCAQSSARPVLPYLRCLTTNTGRWCGKPESPYRRAPRCGPTGPCGGPGRERPASKDSPGRRVRVADAAAALGCGPARWAPVSRSCSAALRAAAAWAARSWFSRSRVTASDSAASWASSASSWVFSPRPTNRAEASSTEAARSPCPACDGAGSRPHSLRAARSY